jgi:hypothetical protein
MLNRKLFSIAGIVIIVVGGLFIWQETREAQPTDKTHKSQTLANPQQVNFLIGDGDRMMEDGDYVGARSFYERALKLDPSNAAARAGIKNAEDSIKNAND